MQKWIDPWFWKLIDFSSMTYTFGKGGWVSSSFSLICTVSLECLCQWIRPISVCHWKKSLCMLVPKSWWRLMRIVCWFCGDTLGILGEQLWLHPINLFNYILSNFILLKYVIKLLPILSKVCLEQKSKKGGGGIENLKTKPNVPKLWPNIGSLK